MTADQNYPLFFQPGLPVSEFTVASRISRGRVYRLLDEGKLTARKLGRITHIEQSPRVSQVAAGVHAGRAAVSRQARRVDKRTAAGWGRRQVLGI